MREQADLLGNLRIPTGILRAYEGLPATSARHCVGRCSLRGSASDAAAGWPLKTRNPFCRLMRERSSKRVRTMLTDSFRKTLVAACPWRLSGDS